MPKRPTKREDKIKFLIKDFCEQSREGMLSLSVGVSPRVFRQRFLTLVVLFQVSQGEPQLLCPGSAVKEQGDGCMLSCFCAPFPLLPPPPPPPPPPRLLLFTVCPPGVPALKPWWKEELLLGTVSGVSLVFLLLSLTVCYYCYKALKRKPLQREENGNSRGEHAMGSSCLKTVDSSSTGV